MGIRSTLTGGMGAALVVALSAGVAPAAAAELTAPVYEVVQEGLTGEEGEQLAERAGTPLALRPDGSFGFVETRAPLVPTKVVGKGTDESGRATVAEAIDTEALARTTVISGDVALRLAQSIVPVPQPYEAEPVVGHTQLEQVDRRDPTPRTTKLDTSVSYRLHLGGAPVVGPGGKVRIAFAGDGSVRQLTHALRVVRRAAEVAIISPEEALRGCTSLYGRDVQQSTPLLAYHSPPLTATDASGRGTVARLVPHYVCQPSTGAVGDRLGGRLLPAAPQLAPRLAVKATSDGLKVVASTTVRGGTAPYRYTWASSSSPTPPTAVGPKVTYALKQRTKGDERLTVTVTDGNGVSATAAVVLPGGTGSAQGASVPGGEGGDLASIGIEQTVDEWACAQGSANGFKSVMKAKGHAVKFDFRGLSAWEKDFKKTSAGGWDGTYVDRVDAQWYTGHGNPNGFSFKSAVDDDWIGPSDARWGDNNNLEWMQLESCQVLRDTTGALDHFARWDEAFDRLHLLNGFHDNARCNAGNGGRFASYLFPETWFGFEVRPALTVQQAWAAMANDLQPAGRRYRTMSPVGAGGVTNLSDHFWGQGSVGPDIPASQVTGWVSISGVS